MEHHTQVLEHIRRTRTGLASRAILLAHACLIGIGMLGTVVPTMGQQLYTGPYLWGDSILGEASFQYIVVRADTLMHGPFRFNSVRTEPGDDLHMRSTELIGAHERGTRTGEWTYRAKDLRATSEPSLADFDLVRKTSGKERLIRGSFKAGRAHGAWHAMGRSIADGSAKDTVFAVQCQFNDGMFTGAASGHLGNIRFNGQFSHGGKPDGPWSFTHTLGEDGSTISEVMTYDEGMLVSHTMAVPHTSEGTPLELLRTTGRTADAVEVPLSEGYFRAIGAGTMDLVAEGNAPTMGPDTLLIRTRQLMMRALTATGATSSPSIWHALAGTQAVQTPLVRLEHHPLDERERKDVADLARMHRESMAIIDHHLKDPLVDLGKYAYEEVERIHAIMLEYATRMKAMEPMVGMLNDTVAWFIDRDAMLARSMPDISFPESVRYTFKEKMHVVAHAFPSPLPHGTANVARLKAHLEEVHRDVVPLGRRSSTILDRYKTQSKLAEEEEKLLALRDSLLILYDEVPKREDRNQYHDMLAGSMRQMVIALFKEYAELDPEEKMERMEGVFNCYREALDAYASQSKIPVRLSKLDETYTRSVWNPYTFTFMEERVKERVYRAYEQVLLPYLLERIRDSVDCGKMGPAHENIAALYRRMEDLREQDTRDLERQLRRVSDPTEVIGILSLQLDLD